MDAVQQTVLQTSHLIGLFIGSIGVLFILFGAMRSMYIFYRRRFDANILLADVRVELGHYLALGLEFLVAMDIIETILDPTWDDLGKLVVIIILRSVLTLFLAHEVKEVREELEQEGLIRQIKANIPIKKR